MLHRRSSSWAVFALCLLCLLGCTAEATEEVATELVAVEGTLRIRHLLSGELVPERAVELAVPEVGVAPLQIRWLAEAGTEVGKGDPVVELDNSQLVSNLEQLDAAWVQAVMSLESARSKAGSEIAEAEFEVRKRQADLEKARIAADIPDILKAARDYEKLQLDVRKAELELAEAERALEGKRQSSQAALEIERVAVEQAAQKLERARRGAELLSLRAPRPGIVLIEENPGEDRPLQEGDNTFPGWTVARLPDLSSLIVRARLFDVDDGTIAPGLPAIVTLDTFPEEELEGRVRVVQRIARQAGRRSLARIFEVLVDVEGIDPSRMRPGMSVRVAVETEIGADADGELPVLVPRRTLDLHRQDPPRVRLADGRLRPVRLGLCSTSHCIVEEGIRAGEALAAVQPLAAR